MKALDKALLGLTGLFLLLLPLQFFFAGLGMFGGSFDTHEAFGGGLLHLLTLLTPIVALFAKRWKIAGLWAGLFVAIILQISLISIGRDAGEAWISALHPFMAFCYWPYVYFLIFRPLKAEYDAATPPDAQPA